MFNAFGVFFFWKEKQNPSRAPGEKLVTRQMWRKGSHFGVWLRPRGKPDWFVLHKPTIVNQMTHFFSRWVLKGEGRPVLYVGMLLIMLIRGCRSCNECEQKSYSCKGNESCKSAVSLFYFGVTERLCAGIVVRRANIWVMMQAIHHTHHHLLVFFFFFFSFLYCMNVCTLLLFFFNLRRTARFRHSIWPVRLSNAWIQCCWLSSAAGCFLESPADRNLMIGLVFVVTKAFLDISAWLALFLP